MTANSLSEDLAWWRDAAEATPVDVDAARDRLERLRAWKIQHDADRAGQRVPFLLMVWDGIFGDEDSAVTKAIAEIEAALAAADADGEARGGAPS